MDDRLSRDRTHDEFEAIVRHLVDPELARLRRLFLGLCVGLYLMAALVVAASGLGWLGLLAFSSTFLPSVVVALVIHRRRFASRLTGAKRFA